MVLFDQDGKIKRYETAEAILEEFFHLRLDYYARRRSALIKVGLIENGPGFPRAGWIPDHQYAGSWVFRLPSHLPLRCSCLLGCSRLQQPCHAWLKCRLHYEIPKHYQCPSKAHDEVLQVLMMECADGHALDRMQESWPYIGASCYGGREPVDCSTCLYHRL